MIITHSNICYMGREGKRSLVTERKREKVQSAENGKRSVRDGNLLPLHKGVIPKSRSSLPCIYTDHLLGIDLAALGDIDCMVHA
jgi:hypothetical protein